MNPRLVAVLAVVVFGVVGGAIWFLQSKPPLTPALLPATPAPLASTTVLPLPDSGNAGTGSPGYIRSTQEPTPPRKIVPAQPLAEWEERIDQVLKSTADEKQSAQMLIAIIPTLPPEGQAEAAQHVVNLVLDPDYGMVLPLLRNPAMPEEVQDVLVTDLMNREDPVKLPALLDIAKLPNHSYHEEALTDLQVYLDEDFGDNWTKWDTAIKAYIRKQQQEEAEANAPEPATPALKLRK